MYLKNCTSLIYSVKLTVSIIICVKVISVEFCISIPANLITMPNQNSNIVQDMGCTDVSFLLASDFTVN